MDSSFDSPSEVCSSVFSFSSSAFASSAAGSSAFASSAAGSSAFASSAAGSSAFASSAAGSSAFASSAGFSVSVLTKPAIFPLLDFNAEITFLAGDWRIEIISPKTSSFDFKLNNASICSSPM